MRVTSFAQGLSAIVLAVANVGIAIAQSDAIGDLDHRRALAEQLAAETLPIMFEDVEANTVNGFPEGPERDLYRQLLKEVLVVGKMAEILVPVIARHFTSEEIMALLAFYQSPVGSSILNKFGAYSAEIQPAISAMVYEAMERTADALETRDR